MSRLSYAMILTAFAVGCGGGSGEGGEDSAGADSPPSARVSIVQPTDGATLDRGPVLFVFEVEGLTVMPAGTMDSGTGHHHLVVDADVNWTEPIGNDPGVHYHMGQAQTEFTVEDLQPGQHRVIAVVADGVHIPLDPPVSDTITITVR